jgi:hypothetical protein
MVFSTIQEAQQQILAGWRGRGNASVMALLCARAAGT